MVQDRNTIEALTSQSLSSFAKSKQEYKRQKYSEYTYHPKINSNYKNAVAPPSRKEKLAEELARKQTEKELEECSFRPQLIAKKPIKQPTKEVKGLERFFELKDMHARKQQQKQVRE